MNLLRVEARDTREDKPSNVHLAFIELPYGAIKPKSNLQIQLQISAIKYRRSRREVVFSRSYRFAIHDKSLIQVFNITHEKFNF